MTGEPGQIAARQLGKTGLRLSTLGLGGAPLGELYERIPESQAVATVECAYDSGIRYYDTAPWYGHGLSEHRMGHVLRHQGRADFVLSTKVGRVYSPPRDRNNIQSGPWVGGLPFEWHFDYSYEGIQRSYQDSIQRLGLNRIDMLFIHDLDPVYHSAEKELDAHCSALLDGGWQALAELRASGAIGAIGAGLNTMAMLDFFLEHVDLDVVLVAMPYTLLDQSAMGHELDLCRERDINIIVGSPYASGILATGPVAGAMYNYAPASAEILEKTSAIEALCQQFDVPLQAAALQFPLGHPAVTAVIPGAGQPEFVAANRRNLDVPIPGALWAALKEKDLLDRDAPTPA